MTRDHDPTVNGDGWPSVNPWPLLLTGVAATGVALLWYQVLGSVGTPWRVLLIVFGLLVAGGGVSFRLRSFGEDFEERLGAASAVLAGALVVLLAVLGTDRTWDSARLLLFVGLGVALAGALLLIMPRGARLFVISGLVLFHFAGILCAVLSIPPPFVVNQLWTHVFRHYLEFAYLNNAYHFYSPEPGPASLLWFRVEYDDDSAYWHKMPNREDFATRLEYQRRLSLTELASIGGPLDPRLNPQDLLLARQQAGKHYQARKDCLPEKVPMARYDVFPPAMQRREIAFRCKQAIESYVRHVARTHPHEDPNVGVRQVKVYRLIHEILPPTDLSKGFDPLDPRTYRPYYQGTFSKDGQQLNKDGKPINLEKLSFEDPFLYWYIPILPAVALEGSEAELPLIYRSADQAVPDLSKALEIRNCLEIHAGDTCRPRPDAEK